jgi:hypothetical protein
MDPEFALQVFGKLNKDEGIALLNDMSSSPNNSSSEPICFSVAIKYHDKLGLSILINFFEENECIGVLRQCLHALVDSLDDL